MTMSTPPSVLIQESSLQQKKQPVGFRKILLLAKAATALLLALVLWELILRSFVDANPGNQIHPELGKINNPGIRVQSWEGFGRVHLNSLGMRAEEIQPKSLNEYRILVLGDSFTRADEVPDNQHFLALTEKALAGVRRDHRKIHFINGGKPGASPANYIHAGSFYRSEINPDSVIVVLTSSDFTGDLLNPQAEFHVKAEKDSFTLVKRQDFESGNALANFVLEKIPQIRILSQLSVLRVATKQVQESLASEDSSSELSPSALAATSTNQPLDADQQKTYEPLIDWTLQQLQQSLPNLVITYLPLINYDDVVTQGARQEASPNYIIEQLLQQRAQEHQIPFISLRQDYVDFYLNQGQELTGFNNTRPGMGHLNAKGHRLVADKLSNFYRGDSQK